MLIGSLYQSETAVDEQIVKVHVAGLAGRAHAHVNLIPVNPVTETGFRPTSGKDTNAFKTALEKRGVTATVRREMGRDIDGACGQLRKRRMSN